MTIVYFHETYREIENKAVEFSKLHCVGIVTLVIYFSNSRINIIKITFLLESSYDDYLEISKALKGSHYTKSHRVTGSAHLTKQDIFGQKATSRR